ncbi:hypothetical protein CEB3_c17010 [Peptococcaceae bacterium CEB3]|nr:hypothetical protein CEB3_c17010 [Peptococcaceae bacterium CEB3]
MSYLKKVSVSSATLILTMAVLLVGCGQQAQPAVATSTGLQKGPAKELTAKDFLTLEKTINLPGKGGHGDIVAYDPAENAVYIDQSPDNNVIVISTKTQDILKVIPDVKSANGIAIGPKYVYVASAGENKLVVIEKGTWNVVARVDTGGKTPDAVYYDGKDNKIFIANDDSDTMGVVSPDSPFELMTSFPLLEHYNLKAKSGPDLGVYIPGKDRLYQSDDNYVLVLNTKTNQLVQKFDTNLPIEKLGATKDMVYDPKTDTIWVGTTSKMVLVMNPDTGKFTKVATLSGMDQVACDPVSNFLFLGEGTSGCMEVVNMGTQKAIGAIPIEKGFHTLDVDTNQHMVYVYANYKNQVEIYKENMGVLKK